MIYIYDIINYLIILVIIITLFMAFYIAINWYPNDSVDDNITPCDNMTTCDNITSPHTIINKTNIPCCSSRAWDILDKNGKCECMNGYTKEEIIKTSKSTIFYSDSPSFMIYDNKPHIQIDNKLYTLNEDSLIIF